MPSSCWMRRSSPRICRRRNSSSADSGSSSSSTRGLVISARASAMRCCWPPESCAGSRSANCFMLHRASMSRARCVPLGLADAAHLEVEGDVVQHAQMREQGIALEHHGGAALHRRQRRPRSARRSGPSPSVGCLVPGDHAQDGGLAAAATGRAGSSRRRAGCSDRCCSTATVSPKRLVTPASSMLPRAVAFFFPVPCSLQFTRAAASSAHSGGPHRARPGAVRRARRRWIMAIEPSASAITTNETSVVTVPSAYSAGEVTLVVIAPDLHAAACSVRPAVSSVRGNSS